MSPGSSFRLNHEDPSVVQLGLREFIAQITLDHDISSSFGYCGRGISSDPTKLLHPPTCDHITGVLKDYLVASPRIEELFVLWNLPGSADDRQLLACIMLCIATILHCNMCNESFLSSVISRILSDHYKATAGAAAVRQHRTDP